MQEPIITVLIPTYEPKAEHLRETIDSLLNQTETRWVAVVRDDASKAVLEEIMRPYRNDPRIVVQHGKERLGIGGNWNACLREADTPFVQYLFQDDLWHPHYLERMLAVFHDHPEVGFASAGHAYVFEGEVQNRASYEELQSFKEQSLQRGLHRGKEFLRWWMERGLHPNVIGEPSFVMIRRSAIEEAGPFSEDMPQFLDVEEWVRLLLVSDWYYLPESLGEFRVHPSGASAQNDASGAGIADRLRTFDRLIARAPDAQTKEVATHARNRALSGMVKKFFSRMKSGKAVGGAGGGHIKRFALRHPVLMIQALFRALTER